MPLPLCGHRADWLCERCARCGGCCKCPQGSLQEVADRMVSINSKRAAIALIFAARKLAQLDLEKDSHQK